MNTIIGLSQMISERSCPHFDVLVKGGKNVLKHIKTCPVCCNSLKNAWLFKSEFEKLDDEILEIISDELAFPADNSKEFKPGDIRQIEPKSDPTEWWDDDGNYYNPPMVLVVAEPVDGVVEVAQVFTSGHLCTIRGCHPIFRKGSRWAYAEKWNQYKVPVEILSKYRIKDTMYGNYFQDFLNAQFDPFMDLTEEDRTFMRLEQKVAEFFCNNH